MSYIDEDLARYLREINHDNLLDLINRTALFYESILPGKVEKIFPIFKYERNYDDGSEKISGLDQIYLFLKGYVAVVTGMEDPNFNFAYSQDISIYPIQSIDSIYLKHHFLSRDYDKKMDSISLGITFNYDISINMEAKSEFMKEHLISVYNAYFKPVNH